jgi:myo-inositol-1(or 4)-monophosphatase
MSASEIDLAISAAREAGALIRDALDQAKNVERKSPINLVTETDRAAETIILGILRAAFPADAIVAEESAGGDRPSGRAWVVDPLDGTTNFVHGLPHCAVSIGLLDDSGPLAAVVYDPCKDELFSAERGSGAWADGKRLSVSAEPQLSESLLVTGFPYDRRTYSAFYLSYFERFLHAARDLRRFGAAALDLCYVAAGRFDGFFEWKLHPWDTAAGWLIVEEAGGRVTNFAGEAYDPWGVRVLATNGHIHDQAVAEFAGLPEHPDDSPVG